MLSILAIFLLAAIPSSQDVREERVTSSQWAVFDVHPRRSIVTVDSLTLRTKDGLAQVLLSAGKHSYKIESPFYETSTGTFDIDVERKSVVRVTLEPLFGLLYSVSPVKGADIYVDYTYSGSGAIEGLRLVEGKHSMMIVGDTICYYKTMLNLPRGERITHDVTEADITPRSLAKAMAEEGLTIADLKGRDDSEKESLLSSGKWSSLSICSNVEDAVVVVNGMVKATTPCVLSPLRVGMKYRITLRKRGYSDVTRTIRLGEGSLTELRLIMKK